MLLFPIGAAPKLPPPKPTDVLWLLGVVAVYIGMVLVMYLAGV